MTFLSLVTWKFVDIDHIILLSFCPVFALDELKHIIGADTTRKGILRVFDMFQYQPMNRRLVYVFLEGFLETMFPQYKFPELFVKLHSRSPRISRYGQKLKCSSLKRWQERTEDTDRLDTQRLESCGSGWEGLSERWVVCVTSALPLPSHTLPSVKTLQLSSWLFLSRQNWWMSNSALFSLCEGHMRKHKSYNLHQDWTWQSFSFFFFLLLFELFSCVKLYSGPANAAFSWFREQTTNTVLFLICRTR